MRDSILYNGYFLIIKILQSLDLVLIMHKVFIKPILFRDITVRSNIAYGGLTNINKTPLAAPAQAVPNTDENTAARLLAHRQSYNI